MLPTDTHKHTHTHTHTVQREVLTVVDNMENFTHTHTLNDCIKSGIPLPNTF